MLRLPSLYARIKNVLTGVFCDVRCKNITILFVLLADIRDMRYILSATAGHPYPLLEDIPGGEKTDPEAARHDDPAAEGAQGHPQACQEVIPRATFNILHDSNTTRPRLLREGDSSSNVPTKSDEK